MQACYDKGMNTAVLALAGAVNFVAAGDLDGVDVFSPEQMMLDREIFERVMASVAPIEIDPDKGLDTIDDIGPGGSFLMHETTLESFRDYIVESRYFDKGGTCIRELIREDIRNTKMAHMSILSKEVQKELDGICEYYYTH